MIDSDYYAVLLTDEGYEITGLTGEKDDDIEYASEKTGLREYMYDLSLEIVDHTMYLVGRLKNDVVVDEINELDFVESIIEYENL